MSVKIRLKRIGRKNRPYFRVAVFDSRTGRDGRTLEIVGHYDPIMKENKGRVVLDRARIEHWVKLGAQPSAQVKNLLKNVPVETEAKV
ncbi:MAG: 30S ribosomal protein S16 [Planctomycetes bacterium]|nr:30S ribosomal protein S16 [Planctomycetota bacterium]MBI3845129.1 30S ribosomal protein S16 [Planctomycetota bacterium]